jgi:hypothetical protein
VSLSTLGLRYSLRIWTWFQPWSPAMETIGPLFRRWRRGFMDRVTAYYVKLVRTSLLAAM